MAWRNRSVAVRPDDHDDHDDHDGTDATAERHDLGLQHDMGRLLGRRRALAIFGGLGATAVVTACGSSAASTGDAADRPDGPPDGAGPPQGGAMGGDSSVEVAAGEIPEETAGPYPGDGSNGPDVLSQTGIVRSDITSSFGDASGTAAGIPLQVDLRLLDVSGDDSEPLAGAAVYLWHCDAEGRYSLYSDGVTEENWLRGVQETDAEGRLSFTSVFPGCYSGRWPHLHFEVYPSLQEATDVENKMRTSQIAFPQDVCEQVYALDEYAGSTENLSALSLDTDGIFSDGWSLQMARLSGSVDDGFTLKISIPV